MRLNVFLILLNCCLVCSSWATPELQSEVGLDSIYGETTYIDYLPRYRSLNTDFLITKIEYTKEKTVFHFRYVAHKDNDPIYFYGKDQELAWELTTSVRKTPTSIARKSEVINIRINDESKKERLENNDELSLTPKRGDIVTCEIHFDNMPNQVRSVHLLGGDVDKQGNTRFVCNDIMIKSKESRILGTPDQMETNIKRFYDRIGKVRYPDIVEATTLTQDKKFAERKEERIEKVVNPIQAALEPIDYMPKSLTSINDIKCNERLILKNVYFEDGKSDYSGRVQAMRTLKVVIEYLGHFPEARIVLHGHTDIFGNAFRNLELSRQRVLTVKRTLISKGVDSDRIITMHHGGSQPLPRYKDGGAMNRRVEMEIVCPNTGGGPQVKTSSITNRK